MAKKVAVLAVNPVNGFGLFQYLEAFFENGISYKVYAVAETKEIKTNSGIELVADNVDLMLVLKAFAGKGKILIGHCAAGLLFDFAGITEGKRLAVHPLAKPAVSKGMATDEKSVVDGNFYTAQSENFVWTMMPQVIEALKK